MSLGRCAEFTGTALQCRRPIVARTETGGNWQQLSAQLQGSAPIRSSGCLRKATLLSDPLGYPGPPSRHAASGDE